MEVAGTSPGIFKLNSVFSPTVFTAAFPTMQPEPPVPLPA